MSRLHVLRDGAFRRDERLKASIADIVAASFDRRRRPAGDRVRAPRYPLLPPGRARRSVVLLHGLVGHPRDRWTAGAHPERRPDCRQARPEGYRQVHQALSPCGVRGPGAGAAPAAEADCLGDIGVAHRLPHRPEGVRRLQPSLDGTYSDDSEQVARAVRRKLGVAQTAGAHPFVFPRLVAGVRFTEAERRRLADVCRAKSFSLFDRLGIDEAQGDRLLFVAAVPAHAVTTCPSDDRAPGGRGPAIPGYPRAARNGGKCS